MNSLNPDKKALEERLLQEGEAFYKRARETLTELFEAAKLKNQLQFALSLHPEFRGLRGPGWNSSEECFVAIKDYLQYLENTTDTDRLKIRVALAFYSHVAEASGFYEVPKNMLRVAGGQNHVLWPFQEIVAVHATTGEAIAPNANKVLKNLIGHCEVSGFKQLAAVFNELFDPDLRNGFAHADYVVWTDGIRLTKRNGGTPRIVPYEEFSFKINRAVDFFRILQEVRETFLNHYNPPKTFRGSLGGAPEQDCTVSYLPGKGLKIEGR